MIKQIVVHPKGATHFQNLGSIYWLKEQEGEWYFKSPYSKDWIFDESLNAHGLGKDFLKPISQY